MSCHTWCAYKVERSIEEARRLFIFKHEKFIEEWKEILANPQHELRTSREGSREEWTQEYMEHYLAVFERQLRMVKAGLCNVAVMKRQPEHSYYIEGRGLFINSEEFGNMFRIGGDPPDEIFSREECMQFIERNKDKIRFSTDHDFDTYKELDEFWTRYPDGYMHFG